MKSKPIVETPFAGNTRKTDTTVPYLCNNKAGITLVALVITIIVLLILAGITINLTVGQNGILNRAGEAGKSYKEAEVRENVELALLDLQTDVIFDNIDLTVEYALTKLEEKGVFEEIDQDEQTGITGGYVITLGYDENGNVIIVDMVPDGIARIQAKILTKGYTKGPVQISINVKTKGETVTSLNIPESMTKKEEIYEVASNGTYLIQAILGNGEIVQRELEITTIDNLPPQAFTITATQIEAKIVITGTAEDTEKTNASAYSGIEKYEYYVKKATDTEYPTTPYATNEIEGLSYDTYNIYAKAYDKAGNYANSNEVTIEMVNPKVSKYGQKVNYSANGVDDWKIFYINEERNETFIITSGYLPVSKVPTAKTGMSVSGAYVAYWSILPNYIEITQEVRDRYMMSWNNNQTNDNIKCISRLLDTNAWDIFVTDELKQKGATAIGSPTLEMFITSWNDVYPKEMLPDIRKDANGYKITTGSGNSWDLRVMQGGKNSLYMLPYNNDLGYWLASPGVGNALIWSVRNGNVGALDGQIPKSYTSLTLRPVVCIPSNLLEYNPITSSWDINLSK